MHDATILAVAGCEAVISRGKVADCFNNKLPAGDGCVPVSPESGSPSRIIDELLTTASDAH